MSNLYKGAFVRARQDHEPVIIDANALFAKRLKEKQSGGFQQLEVQEYDLSATAASGESGDFEALDTDQLEQLLGSQEPPADEAAEVVPAGPSPEEIAAAEAHLEEVRAEASKLIAEAQAKAEEIRTEATKQGYDEGYQAGKAAADKELEDQSQALSRKEKELEEEYRHLLDAAEPEMVETLTHIYEHVFGVRFTQDKAVILHLLRQTLARTEPVGDFLIHASGADYEALLDAKEELRAMIPNPNSTLEIVEDTFLKQNECMIETDGGVFDCGVGTELSELAKKLKILSWRDRRG